MASKTKPTRFEFAPSKFKDRLLEWIHFYSGGFSNNSWHFDSREINLCLESIATENRAIPNATFGLQIKQEMCNFTKNLHGGCAATLIDDLTTIVLLAVSQEGFYKQGGVSRKLTTTYFRPVPVGTGVTIVCEVVNIGKSMVLLRAGIYRVDTGQLCVQGENEKANSDDLPLVKL